MDSKKVLTNPIIAALLAIGCHILWGIVFPIIKKCYILFSIETIGDTYLFASIRFIVAGLILLAIASVRDRKLPKVSKTQLRNLFILGTIQTGATYLLQFAALIKASAINCSIINGTFVVTSNIMAHFIFSDDRMSRRKVVGSIMAFSGVLFCFLYGGRLESLSLAGEGLMFLSISFFALGSVLSRMLAKDTDPAIASGYNLLFGGLEIFLLAIVLRGQLSNGGAVGFALYLLLALISSVCYMIWTALLKANPAGRMTVYQCANPISGAIAASLILGENVFQMRYVVAIILVSIGIVVINGQKSTK